MVIVGDGDAGRSCDAASSSRRPRCSRYRRHCRPLRIRWLGWALRVGRSHSTVVVALPSMNTEQHGLRTRKGFAEAYDRHARSILVFLVRRTCDPDTAMDLTAETFAQAFTSRRRFRGTTDEDAAAWLFAIARNVLSRYVRRGSAERRALRRLGVEVPPWEPQDLARVVELAGLDDLRGAVAREMGALPEAHREALQLARRRAVALRRHRPTAGDQRAGGARSRVARPASDRARAGPERRRFERGSHDPAPHTDRDRGPGRARPPLRCRGGASSPDGGCVRGVGRPSR